MSEDPLVSVVMPAKNEAGDIGRALSQIGDQDIDLSLVEVVVVDGDSDDDTAGSAIETLMSLGLARWDVLPNPGGNTPSNLNRGLEWASGKYVVRVDARSLIPQDYIRRTITILDDREEVSVAGGSQVAAPRDCTPKAKAIASALNNPVAMGGSSYRREGAPSGPTDTVYLGVFRRTQLIDAGGWNEHFSTNQDFELNQRMADHGTIWFEAGLPVSYLPRGSIGGLIKQYHRFGRWKAHYWQHTKRSPNGRQWLLLALPPAALVLAATIGRILGARRTIAGVGIAAAGLSSRATDTLPWLINGVIAAAWWSGVLRGVFRDDVAP